MLELQEFAFVDLSRVFPDSSKAKLEKQLVAAGLNAMPGPYLSAALTLSAFIAFVSFLSMQLVSLEFILSLGVSLLLFSLVFFVFLKLPEYKGRKRAERIEKQLPAALNLLAARLQHSSFESALESVSRGSGELGLEVRKVLKDLRNGYSAREALSSLSDRTGSLQLKRACSQLLFVYGNGRGAEALKQLSQEIVLQQKQLAAKYYSQLAFLGILFIAASAVIPALFSAYLIIGSSFFSLTFSPQDILIAYSFVFPFIVSLILFYAKETAPEWIY